TPAERVAGRTYNRFSSHVSCSSRRTPTQPQVSRATRATSSAPPGGPYAPGRLASSCSKSWKSSENASDAAYSPNSVRTVPRSEASASDTCTSGATDVTLPARSWHRHASFPSLPLTASATKGGHMRKVIVGMVLAAALAVPGVSAAHNTPPGVICGQCDDGGTGWTGCAQITASESGGVSYVAHWRHY